MSQIPKQPEVTFFTPIQYKNGDGAEKKKSLGQKLAQMSEDYFYFSGKAVIVVDTKQKTGRITTISPDETPEKNPVLTALKVASYCTLVIPTIMFAIKAITRPDFKIQTKKAENSSEGDSTSKTKSLKLVQSFTIKQDGTVDDTDYFGIIGSTKEILTPEEVRNNPSLYNLVPESHTERVRIFSNMLLHRNDPPTRNDKVDNDNLFWPSYGGACDLLYESLDTFLKENPKDAKKIVDQALKEFKIKSPELKKKCLFSVWIPQMK